MIVGGIPMLFGGAPAGDPLRANRMLVLHGEGANNGTTFTDSSPSAKTLSRFGSAVVTSTSQAKLGNSAIYYNNTNSHLTVPSSSAWDFGTGDFAMEGFVRLTSIPNSTVLFARGNSSLLGCFEIYVYTNGAAYANAYLTSGVVSLVSAIGAITTGAWHHLAFTRSGSTFRLFVNGVQVATGTSALSMRTSSNILCIGGYEPSSLPTNGYIDEGIITKGDAVYTANFTPPTTQLLDF